VRAYGTLPYMPIIQSAKKKMRKDKTRTLHNQQTKGKIKRLVKDTRRNSSAESLQKVFSALDKAAKVKLIHPNKAARLKSRLSKASAAA
jgi:small subunit ribosomal protein S20